MKIYVTPKVRVRLHETDVVTASVTFDEVLGDYYMADPFSDDNFTGGQS